MLGPALTSTCCCLKDGIRLRTGTGDGSAQEIYTLYKKRWTIETFCNHFKDRADYRALYMQDYYKTQGLAFIMLVSALIHHGFEEATEGVKRRSVQDFLFDACMVKANKRHDVWCVCLQLWEKTTGTIPKVQCTIVHPHRIRLASVAYLENRKGVTD